MKKMDNKGFSLVELIIVIAIMAILVGVLAPQFVKYVEQSRESTDLQNIEEMKTAIETYCADNGYADPFTVTVAGTANIAVSPTGKLSEYGVTDSYKPKSQKLTTFTWTYTNYSWSCNIGTNSPAATYYNVDGTKI